jgi:hypothetical protein
MKNQISNNLKINSLIIILFKIFRKNKLIWLLSCPRTIKCLALFGDIKQKKPSGFGSVPSFL